MVKHYVLTLTTGAQQFSKVLANTNASGASADAVPRWGNITVQADSGATGAIYIGGYGTQLTTSIWGIFIPIPASSVPAAPISLGPGTLDDWVATSAAATDKLHITVTTT